MRAYPKQASADNHKLRGILFTKTTTTNQSQASRHAVTIIVANFTDVIVTGPVAGEVPS